MLKNNETNIQFQASRSITVVLYGIMVNTRFSLAGRTALFSRAGFRSSSNCLLATLQRFLWYLLCFGSMHILGGRKNLFNDRSTQKAKKFEMARSKHQENSSDG